MKEDDLVISDYIARTGAWELENVENLMKAMSLYKDAVLVGRISHKDFPSYLYVQMHGAI